MVFYGLDELDVFEDGRFAGCETGSGDAAGSFGGAWARHVHATCSRDNREDDRYGMHSLCGAEKTVANMSTLHHALFPKTETCMNSAVSILPLRVNTA